MFGWYLFGSEPILGELGNQPLRVYRGPRKDGSGRPPPDAPATKARACPFVKPVREPDAGDPQVRFDERRWETELRPRLRHRHQRESRRQQLLPQPKATAHAADSPPGGRAQRALPSFPSSYRSIFGAHTAAGSPQEVLGI